MYHFYLGYVNFTNLPLLNSTLLHLYTYWPHFTSIKKFKNTTFFLSYATLFDHLKNDIKVKRDTLSEKEGVLISCKEKFSLSYRWNYKSAKLYTSQKIEMHNKPQLALQGYGYVDDGSTGLQRHPVQNLECQRKNPGPW